MPISELQVIEHVGGKLLPHIIWSHNIQHDCQRMHSWWQWQQTWRCCATHHRVIEIPERKASHYDGRCGTHTMHTTLPLTVIISYSAKCLKNTLQMKVSVWAILYWDITHGSPWMPAQQKKVGIAFLHIPCSSHSFGSPSFLSLPYHLLFRSLYIGKAVTWIQACYSPKCRGKYCDKLGTYQADICCLPVWGLSLNGSLLFIALGPNKVRKVTFDDFNTVVMGTDMCCRECRWGQLGTMRTASGIMGESRGSFLVGTSHVCIGRDFSNPVIDQLCIPVHIEIP